MRYLRCSYNCSGDSEEGAFTGLVVTHGRVVFTRVVSHRKAVPGEGGLTEGWSFIGVICRRKMVSGEGGLTEGGLPLG